MSQEKQVAQLRERSKLDSHAASAGNEREQADGAHQDRYQNSHAADLRNGDRFNDGSEQPDNDAGDGEHDPHGIHHYSQQRPAEVQRCLLLTL